MHSLIDALETRFNSLLNLMAALVAVSIGFAVILIPLNLILIKLKLGSLWWIFSSVEYGLYFGVFAAAPWVLQQGSHVRVDLLSSALPEAAAAKLDKFINIFGAALCLVLCFYGSRASLIEFIDQTMPDRDLQVANWIMVAVFTFSFAMSAAEFLFRLRKVRVLQSTGSTTAEASF